MAPELDIAWNSRALHDPAATRHPSRWPCAGPVLVGGLLALGSFVLCAPDAAALRIVDYNILNYPGLNAAGRQPHYRTVLGALGADVVVVQEMQSQSGVDSFRNLVLNTIEPGQWASAPFINGNDTDNALFYKPAKVQFLGQWAFYPSVDNLRYVSCYRLKPAGYSDASAEFRIYSLHLKASSSSSDVQQRFREATGLRDSMNAAPPGTHSIVLGDFNIYSGSEPAFTKMRESQVNNIGRVYDPLNAPLITWNTPSLASIHTQSPCSTCPGGFSTGGLDDRFDMILPTYNWNDAAGLDLVAGSYVPVGNDGLHYNGNITDPPTIPEGSAYANALYNASDHLPVRFDIQVPAKLSAPLALDLGTVIEDGYGFLAVSNPATPPADELVYTFTTSPEFTAPSGEKHLDAQASPILSVITPAPGFLGTLEGSLTVHSNAPDDAAHEVSLTAHVLRHATASLDSALALTNQEMGFGSHLPGEFAPAEVRVHNHGYNAGHARLSLEDATIVGGDDRFSIVGEFTPVLLAATGMSYSIVFDDTDATQDTTYQATLTFISADEPLSGAVAQPDLVVSLTASILSGTAAVGSDAPASFALARPAPNPLTHATRLAFDLPRAADVRLEVFDVAGRRVATLANGAFEAGRHARTWEGRDRDGLAVGPGIYLLRLAARGFTPQIARVAVVR